MDITVLDGYYYTKEHEWAKIEGGRAKIGISDYAQQKLGDITGIESVKAASDIYSPLSGKILDFNNDLEQSPELINESCHEKGWIVELELSDPGETKNLMGAADYRTYVAGLE
jgi:glycine cleavage system H protein